MMDFKTELANAVKLFILLSLLFWSFTWNSDVNLDLFHQNQPDKAALEHSKDASLAKTDSSMFVNQHSDLIETFLSVRFGSEKASKTVSYSAVFIPSFNEWKEIEKLKYDKVSSTESNRNNHHRKKVAKRKLNYASSKCGAKILASNPETKYRIAILNERPDEYMLNPCRVQKWFVIELCDSVEATQIELANYELYSSSPKGFSVFWSDVYPTYVWHLLGTFEAKDQRIMQTFNISSKNLGKFIKVIVHSHHGSEHYCPLSVIRVLGYSMVEDFEDRHNSEQDNHASEIEEQSRNLFEEKLLSDREQIVDEMYEYEPKSELFKHSKKISLKLCSLYFIHCSHAVLRDDKKFCLNKPICQLLVKTLQMSGINCENNFCLKRSTVLLGSNYTAETGEQQENSSLAKHFFPLTMESKHTNGKKVTLSNFGTLFEDYRSESSRKGISKLTSNKDGKRNKASNSRKGNVNLQLNSTAAESFNKSVENGTVLSKIKVSSKYSDFEKCPCENGEKQRKTTKEYSKISYSKEIEQSSAITEKEVDSAGLIQKESVLFKLTARLKASEIDLNLINKYLQQLSQSYRKQMEEMQVMFNQTVQAVNAASGKAMAVDKKQQESINALQQKVTSLTRKVDYLMNGQRDMLKRVVEIHAFFLILEFIIISSIFTIFLNISSRKNTSLL